MTDAGVNLREWAENYIISHGGSVCPEVGDSRLAPTGEPYVTLMYGGIKDEGLMAPPPKPSAEGAMDAWQMAFLSYASDGSCAGLTLYWRMLPVVERDHERGGWHVYSRLLVSDKPVVQKGKVGTLPRGVVAAEAGHYLRDLDAWFGTLGGPLDPDEPKAEERAEPNWRRFEITCLPEAEPFVFLDRPPRGAFYADNCAAALTNFMLWLDDASPRWWDEYNAWATAALKNKRTKEQA